MAEGSLDADSSLLNELIQCSEVGGMGAEARKARHKAHRSSRAPRLRGPAGHRLDAVGTWLVPRRLPTALVGLRVSSVYPSARGVEHRQLSAKSLENGLDTFPSDGALAGAHRGADY